MKNRRQKQYAQSAPISGFNSADTSREQSPIPLPPPRQRKYNYTPWLIGGGALPLIYGGARWLLNRPSVQAMIARTFNKGNRLVEAAQVLPMEAPGNPPSHTPLPKVRAVGIR